MSAITIYENEARNARKEINSLPTIASLTGDELTEFLEALSYFERMTNMIGYYQGRENLKEQIASL